MKVHRGDETIDTGEGYDDDSDWEHIPDPDSEPTVEAQDNQKGESLSVLPGSFARYVH